MTQRFAVAFSLLFLAGVAVAQDVHFTQFYATPLTLNPALTGGFDGRLRSSIIYRDQWRGALANPFVTTSAALDFRFPVKVGGRSSGDAAAAGIMFMNDRVREFDYSHNQIMASGAYHKLIDKRTNQMLSGGIQVGIGQRNINYSDLTFQDEFSIRPNGTTGFFNQTREELPPNNIAYFDMNAGINYSYAPRGRAAVFAGAAVHHLTEPDLSFATRDDAETNEAITQPLRRKFTAHVAGSLPLTSLVSMLPRALIQLQGQHLQAVAGTNFRLAFDEFSSTAVHLGSWVRGVRNANEGIGLDAVVALIGFEYKNVLLGTSYDIGLSDFTAGSRGRGALEVSLAFLGNYENEALSCPTF